MQISVAVLLVVFLAQLLARSDALRGSSLRAVSNAAFATTLSRGKFKDVVSRGASTVRNLSLSPLEQDVVVSTVAVGGTVVWLQIWISLAKSGKIDSKLSRKIIHAGSAPIFMLLWPLYSGGPSSRYFAAGVVGLQVLRLVYAGTKSSTSSQSNQSKGKSSSSSAKGEGGLVVSGERESNDGLAGAISRSGDKKEALQGPLIYAIIFCACTLLWFRSSPIGVVAVTQMAAGDGFADIVGRRWGKSNVESNGIDKGSDRWIGKSIQGKWSFNPDKSYAGSAGFVVAAFVVTSLILALFSHTGVLTVPLDVGAALPRLLLISVLCAAVEVVPFLEDNISVPVAGAVFASLLL
jgi:dolichol kinase